MPVDIEDKNSLQIFLQDLGKIEPHERCAMQILKGGVSNKTVLFTREKGEQWVIKQALSKLRVAQDWYCGPERLKIEFEGMKWLTEVLPEGYVPQPVFYNEANHVLAMKAVPQSHDNLKSLLFNGEIELEWISNLGNILGTIHMSGRDSVEAKSLFGDRSFFLTLRLEAYYQFTSNHLPQSKRFFDDLITKTLSIRQTVVHGDFSPKNILVRNDKIILLDHEVMHYGDPAFDIGFCLCHFLSKANHFDSFRGKLIQAAHVFWKSYIKIYNDADKQVEKRAVCHTIGCLLARIKGRSPLEYLNEKKQQRQIKVGLELLDHNISSIPELIEVFEIKMNKY